ncbi:glutathione S-transferase theta-1 isoform X1 [Columba livia]|uniref:glutathione S-transferase theta-1 isoform X1 n=1 Tax=Columba livia TaxID=8932 RepID=UPI0028C2AB2E|nr:glutathione S-transferase theta-1 [Columba livia]
MRGGPGRQSRFSLPAGRAGRRRMGLELYLDLLSQPCRSIYIFARSNNIPFEFKQVELFKDSVLGKKPAAGSGEEPSRAGPSNSDRASKVSLLKKVPALKDGDFTLAECTAILLYLSRKYNTPDHWYPSDIQKRARVDEYLSWHHANIRANAPKTMWIKLLIPLITGQPLPAEKLQEVMEGLFASLKQFEERFLQDKAFIIGSEISLADLVAIVELMQPVGVGCDIFEDRPRLLAWRRRVEDAVGKELFFQAHEMLLNIKELSNIQIDPQLKEHLTPLLMKMLK